MNQERASQQAESSHKSLRKWLRRHPELIAIFINGAIAVLAAAITAFTTIRSASTELESAQRQAASAIIGAKDAAAAARNVQLRTSQAYPERFPLGGIVASTLPWEKFSKAASGTAMFSEDRSTWAPCDGRSIAGSRLEQELGVATAPDLRGVFLRGLNEFVPGHAKPLDPLRADPEGNRAPGSFQADAIGSHSHDIGFQRHGLKNGKGDINLELESPNLSGERTRSEGGPETRPKNIAVYYYVRINR